MAKIKINITEDHLKLIKRLTIEQFNDYKIGFDLYSPYGGIYLMEDLAMILDYWDKATEGTEKDFDGRKFGLDNEIEMLKIHNYVVDNFSYILSIITQFVDIGVKPGLYTCIDTIQEWTYSETK